MHHNTRVKASILLLGRIATVTVSFRRRPQKRGLASSVLHVPFWDGASLTAFFAKFAVGGRFEVASDWVIQLENRINGGLKESGLLDNASSSLK